MKNVSVEQISNLIEEQLSKYIDSLKTIERNQYSLKENQVIISELITILQNSIAIAGNNIDSFSQQITFFMDNKLYESRILQLESQLEKTRKSLLSLTEVIYEKYNIFKPVEDQYKERILNMDIRKTTLPTKIINYLIAGNIPTLSHLLLYNKEEILKIYGISDKSIKIIDEYLSLKDIKWIEQKSSTSSY